MNSGSCPASSRLTKTLGPPGIEGVSLPAMKNDIPVVAKPIPGGKSIATRALFRAVAGPIRSDCRTDLVQARAIHRRYIARIAHRRPFLRVEHLFLFG